VRADVGQSRPRRAAARRRRRHARPVPRRPPRPPRAAAPLHRAHRPGPRAARLVAGVLAGRCRYHSAAEMLAVADRLVAEDLPGRGAALRPRLAARRPAQLRLRLEHRPVRRPGRVRRGAARAGPAAVAVGAALPRPGSPLHAEALAAGHLVVDAAGRPSPSPAPPPPTGAPAPWSTSARPPPASGGPSCTGRCSTRGWRCSRPTSARGCPTGRR
jgi:hypothetical protein